jgi:hypothetical protein
MVRIAFLALALALGGGAPHLGHLLDLASAVWAADQVDAGGHADPYGSTATTDAGNIRDPNG